MSSPLRIIVLMGPAGAGKTTVGKLLADALGWSFLDADEFHSAANVEKMRHGISLTDADRGPWLSSIRSALEASYLAGTSVVLACSALKEEYRQGLVPDRAKNSVQFVYLHAPPEVLRMRLATRVGHYAGPALLDSQLATLEEPRHALWVDASEDPPTIVARIQRQLGS